MPDNATPLKLPIELYTMPRQFEAVFNGKVYVGRPDTDPTAPANRITVYQEAEDSTLIPIAQPVSINAGGYPTVGGQVVKLVVTEDYSIAVHDRMGAQAYYFPRCAGPYVLNIFHDQTLHGSGSESDRLGVHLSNDTGNLLEIRADGLYYGTTATDNLLNLFVDSEKGNDSNPGSRAEPLKTLNKALTLTPSNKTNTIHLRAGQTFILGISANVDGCSRSITLYDDPWVDGDNVPDLTPSNPIYYADCVAALRRPTIKAHLEYQNETRIAIQNAIDVRGGGSLSLTGLIIDSIPDNGDQAAGWSIQKSAPIYGDSSGTIVMRGCYLISSATKTPAEWTVVSNYAEGGFPSVRLNRCVFLSGAHYIELGGVFANMTITDEWPGQYEIEYIKGNLAQATKDGKLAGIMRGPNGEPRNLMINLVV